MVRLRAATSDDSDFLCEMVAVAADWRPGTAVRSVAALLTDPGLAHYAVGWPGVGDDGLIAEAQNASPVAAAWWRCFSRDDQGYGFVVDGIPEVSIGVVSSHRGRGVGSSLMRELIVRAGHQGLPGLSLSVEPDNFAARLYTDLGFRRVGCVGGAVTMLLPLDDEVARAASRKVPPAD